MSKKKVTCLCPCGSSKALQECCGPYLEGTATAPTAEKLMRSRYSAYALGNHQYILDTWHPTTRPDTLDTVTSPAVKWTGLQIMATDAGQVTDTQGIVEFVARYKLQGRAQQLRERSRFRKENGLWYYLDASDAQ